MFRPSPLVRSLRPAHLAELQRRYDGILAAQALDAIVLHSGVPRARRHGDDQHWPLLPMPHFTHWLPTSRPECSIVVRGGRRPLLIGWIDDSFWEQAPIDELPTEGFDVVEVKDPHVAAQHLPGGRVAFVGEPEAAVWDRFEPELRNPGPLVAALDAARTLKTPYEVECLFQANRRAAVGHRRLADSFAQEDLSELHLHLAYLGATLQDDADTPYKNIVAKGEHAATLHHVTYRRQAAGEGSLLVDAGAGFLGYGSDITRTHVRGTGEGAERFRALLAALDRVQQRICALVRPGLLYEELHDRSHLEVAGVMRDVGLCRVSAEEAVSSGITRAFYPHGLGHSLGVQTHDVGCAQVRPRADNPFLRNTSTIAVGQVFTIEPGLYFIRSLLEPVRRGPHAAALDWSLVDALSPYGGIRIEDDVVVGEGRVRNLTREAFAELR